MNEGAPTDVGLPAVVLVKVGWIIVLMGEYVTVLAPDSPKENEFENAGLVNDGKTTDATLPTVELRGLVWTILLIVDGSSGGMTRESKVEGAASEVDDWVGDPSEMVERGLESGGLLLEVVTGESERENPPGEVGIWVGDPSDGVEGIEREGTLDEVAARVGDSSEIVVGESENDELLRKLN